MEKNIQRLEEDDVPSGTRSVKQKPGTSSRIHIVSNILVKPKKTCKDYSSEKVVENDSAKWSDIKKNIFPIKPLPGPTAFSRYGKPSLIQKPSLTYKAKRVTLPESPTIYDEVSIIDDSYDIMVKGAKNFYKSQFKETKVNPKRIALKASHNKFEGMVIPSSETQESNNDEASTWLKENELMKEEIFSEFDCNMEKNIQSLEEDDVPSHKRSFKGKPSTSLSGGKLTSSIRNKSVHLIQNILTKPKKTCKVYSSEIANTAVKVIKNYENNSQKVVENDSAKRSILKKNVLQLKPLPGPTASSRYGNLKRESSESPIHKPSSTYKTKRLTLTESPTTYDEVSIIDDSYDIMVKGAKNFYKSQFKETKVNPKRIALKASHNKFEGMVIPSSETQESNNEEASTWLKANELMKEEIFAELDCNMEKNIQSLEEDNAPSYKRSFKRKPSTSSSGGKLSSSIRNKSVHLIPNILTKPKKTCKVYSSEISNRAVKVLQNYENNSQKVVENDSAKRSILKKNVLQLKPLPGPTASSRYGNLKRKSSESSIQKPSSTYKAKRLTLPKSPITYDKVSIMDDSYDIMVEGEMNFYKSQFKETEVNPKRVSLEASQSKFDGLVMPSSETQESNNDEISNWFNSYDSTEEEIFPEMDQKKQNDRNKVKHTYATSDRDEVKGRQATNVKTKSIQDNNKGKNFSKPSKQSGATYSNSKEEMGLFDKENENMIRCADYLLVNGVLYHIPDDRNLPRID